MGWKKSAPYGASDLAKIRAGFQHKAERLLLGAQIAQNLELSDDWYQLPRAANGASSKALKPSAPPAVGQLRRIEAIIRWVTFAGSHSPGHIRRVTWRQLRPAVLSPACP